MKTHFSYYYKYTEEELKALFSQAIVSCDTNVLLNMYRYPQEDSLLFLDILEKYSDRLWLSYQAAWEFHKDRLSVLSSLKGKCKEVESLFNKFEEELNNKVQPNNLLRIKSKLTGAIAKIKKELSKAKEICNSEYESIDKEINSDEIILDRILTLFDGKVGEELERLEDVYKEGKKRYEQKNPAWICRFEGKER